MKNNEFTPYLHTYTFKLLQKTKKPLTFDSVNGYGVTIDEDMT